MLGKLLGTKKRGHIDRAQVTQGLSDEKHQTRK